MNQFQPDEFAIVQQTSIVPERGSLSCLEFGVWSSEFVNNKDSGEMIVKEKKHACLQRNSKSLNVLLKQEHHITPLKGISKIASKIGGGWSPFRFFARTCCLQYYKQILTVHVFSRVAILLNKFYPNHMTKFSNPSPCGCSITNAQELNRYIHSE